MYRKVFVAENRDDLTVKLPDDYLHKEVEVLAFEIKKDIEKNEVNDFSDAEAFFNQFSIDMSNFKFNRDEANER